MCPWGIDEIWEYDKDNIADITICGFDGKECPSFGYIPECRINRLGGI